jgi:hypothetical protein
LTFSTFVFNCTVFYNFKPNESKGDSEMKRTIVLGSVAALVMALSLVAVAAKANFSGTWTLDKSHSEGLPPELKDQTLTVVQTDDKITIETTIVRDSGEMKQSDAYVLSGKEVEFKPQPIMGIEGKGKRTAQWAADGNSLDIKEEATYEGPDGPVAVQITRKWTLSADGKSLVIDMNITSPQGSRQMKRAFTKSK